MVVFKYETKSVIIIMWRKNMVTEKLHQDTILIRTPFRAIPERTTLNICVSFVARL